MPPFFVYVAMDLCFSSPVSPARARDMRSHSSALSHECVSNDIRFEQSIESQISLNSNQPFLCEKLSYYFRSYALLFIVLTRDIVYVYIHLLCSVGFL